MAYNLAAIPREWKPAGAGEEELDYFLYDIQVSGTTGGATITLFDNTQSGSGRAVTNMPVAGQLPSTQRFLITELRVNFDPEVGTNDIKDLCDQGLIEIFINNHSVFMAPLLEVVSPNSFMPQGATETISHHKGDLFVLDKYLVIGGGVNFRVEVVVGATAAANTQDIIVSLRGRLVRPA